MNELPNMPPAAGGKVPPETRGKKLSLRIRGWWSNVTHVPMNTREKVTAAIMIIVFLFAFYLALDANKYRALVHVIAGEGKVGINPTADALDFGDLSRGTSAVRRVDLTNNTPIPMYVMILKVGSISDLMKVDKNFFTVGAHASTTIEFTVYMPASASTDSDYTGRVLLFKVPI